MKPRKAAGRLRWPTCTSEPVKLPNKAENQMFLYVVWHPGAYRRLPGSPGKPLGGLRKATREAPGGPQDAFGKPRVAPGRPSWATCTSEPANLPKVAKPKCFFVYFCYLGACRRLPGSPREAPRRPPKGSPGSRGRHPEALEGPLRPSRAIILGHHGALMQSETAKLPKVAKTQLFLMVLGVVLVARHTLTRDWGEVRAASFAGQDPWERLARAVLLQ